MAKLIVSEYVSIDGVIQAPGGGEDYEHAGWTFEFDGIVILTYRRGGPATAAGAS